MYLLKQLSHRLWVLFIGLFCLTHLAVANAHSWPWSAAHSADFWTDIGRSFEVVKLVHDKHYRHQRQYLLSHKHRIRQMAKDAQPFIYYLTQQAKAHHMPLEIALLPMVESQFKPFAYSKTGATGLWQLMPGTAAGYQLTMDWYYDGRRDVVQSTHAALAYLSYLHHFFHDWLLAIAAYNAGEGRILRAIRQNLRHHRPIDFWSLSLPKETTIYVPKFLAMMDIIAHHQRYGLVLPSVSPHVAFQEVSLPKAMSLTEAAEFMGVSDRKFRLYNAGFRRHLTGPHWHRIIVPTSALATYRRHMVQRTHHVYQNQQAHYRVRPGDTLSTIAFRENISVKKLKRLNHLVSSVIHPGQVLALAGSRQIRHAAKQLSLHVKSITEEGIPGPQHKTHAVVRGDTFERLAHRYGVTVSQIHYWNHFSHRHQLRVGETIHLWVSKRRVKHRFSRYRVRRGDTLGQIALRFRTRSRQIKQLNHLKGSLIWPGMRLIVPRR